MCVAKVLAEIALETKYKEISSNAYDAAKKLILDTIACAAAGSSQPGVEETLNTLNLWKGEKDATVLFHKNIRLPLPNAAFVNSVMVHALDLDDVYIPASLHLTSVIFPALLAVAEYTDASAIEFLAAFITSVEVSCRLGFFAQKKRRDSSFLPTSLICSFGATTGIARLMQMSMKDTLHSMGINYAQISGNREALIEMSLTKRLQPAFAARNAIWAAFLAKNGISGSIYSIEGKAGLFGTYLKEGAPEPDEIKNFQSRSEWQIEEVTLKRFPACGASHSMIKAALRLAHKYEIKTNEIEKVEISWGGNKNNILVGYPFRYNHHPQVSAQFSAPYMVAAALYSGEIRISEFTDQAILRNTQVIDLAKKVIMTDMKEEEIPLPSKVELPPNWPKYCITPHTVKVTMKNGKVFAESVCPGEIFLPEYISWDDVINKFRECMEMSSSELNADKIIDTVVKLDKNFKITQLIQLLVSS